MIHALAHLLRINGCKTKWFGDDCNELWAVCATCGKKQLHLSTLDFLTTQQPKGTE